MKFKEAMNGPDCNKWKEEIKNEHKQSMEAFGQKGFTGGSEVITSTLACKKKTNGTYHGSLNARIFMQVAGKLFDLISTAAPVMNDTTIKIVLVLMLLAHWTGRK